MEDSEADDWATALAGGSEEVVGELGMRGVPDYVEFIGAKKHLVLGLLSHTFPSQGSYVLARG